MNLVELLEVECVPADLSVDSVVDFGDSLLRRANIENWAEESTQLSLAPLPELIALAEAFVRNGKDEARPLVNVAIRQLTETATNLVFADASDVLLNCPRILTSDGSRISRGLLARFEEIRSTGSGYQAYRCLETTTRIALAGAARELRVVDTLLDLTSADAPELLERVPRLLGIADEVWSESRSRDILRMLIDVEDARSGALFELGLAELRDSLASDNQSDARSHMTAGRDTLLAAERAVEARDDAAIYRCVLDAVLSFGSVDAVDSVNAAVNTLSEVAARRAEFASGVGNRDWLESRARAEVEWYSLARTLRESVKDIHRPSWLRPAEAMERVLNAYTADRSITVLDCVSGLRTVIQPAIRGAFIRREGLLAHVEDLVSDPSTDPTISADLAAFLSSIRATDPQNDGGDRLGKALEVAPNLTLELGLSSAPSIVQLVEQQPDLAAKLERGCTERRLASRLEGDPLIDDLLSVVESGLSESPDFTGTIRQEFLELVEPILQFMASRADIGQPTIGARTKYLFPPAAGERRFTENYLQRDLGEFLQATRLRPRVRFEESDLASGRADLTVSTSGNRFSIEIKRELRDASRESIRLSYSAQAAGYAVTSVGLGVLMVLDLTNHENGIPSVRDSVWVQKVSVPEGADRFLMVGVVRGNRLTPSQLRIAE